MNGELNGALRSVYGSPLEPSSGQAAELHPSETMAERESCSGLYYSLHRWTLVSLFYFCCIFYFLSQASQFVFSFDFGAGAILLPPPTSPNNKTPFHAGQCDAKR